MNIFQIIVLSIIEGITEFLPISSTAHLIFFSKILKITPTDFHKLFEVFIQAGAILSVILIYKNFVFKNKKIFFKTLISFLPTGIIGFIFYKLIKNIFFESNFLISFSLIFLGLFFLLIEKLIAQKKMFLSKRLEDLTFKEAFIAGFFQSLAIIPGISRAGVVMVTMMMMNYRREDSAIFSFLLAIPTIILASLFDLYKNKEILFLNQNYFFTLILGFFLSFIFALISIKFFISYLRKKNLVIFGFYRIILGIINFFI